MTTARATRKWGGIIAGLGVGSFVGIQALLAALATPAGAQGAKGLVDPNVAAESELQSLPAMTPALAKSMIERRPFKSAIELNKFLLDQKFMPEQVKAFYGKAFVPINLNTGTRDEFMLIPGVGTRMSAEFMEYRPWKSWAQFDTEIGKYVGQQETDRFKPYVFIPPN
jgi:DNA uptake protein ComE-like DNA-binding protein